MRGELLETKSDALLFFIEVEDNHVELLVKLYDFAGIIYAAPRQVGDVDETIYATQVDKYAVGSDVLDSTFEHLALLELRNDFLLLGFEFGLDECLMRHYHILVLLVDLDYLELHRLAYEYVVVADGLHVNLRTGQEGLDAEDVYNHTALRAALDVTLDDFLALKGCIDTLPRLAGTSLLVREYELATLVFLIVNVNFNHVTHLQFGVVAEFAYGDDAIALVADVYNNLALVDRDNRTFHNLVLVDTAKGAVVGFLLFFLAVG